MKRLLLPSIRWAATLGLAASLGVIDAQVARAECLPNKMLAFGAGYSFGIPNGCTRMKVEMWGAGGNSFQTNSLVLRTGYGGGGGYSMAILSVSGGQVFFMSPGGEGGIPGAGGGRTVLLETTSEPDTTYMLAGGGGGAGGSPDILISPGSGGGGGGHHARDGEAGAGGAGGGGGAHDGVPGAGGEGTCEGTPGSASGAPGSPGCLYGGRGGRGYAGGGGAATLGPSTVGGGGGGGSSFLLPGAHDEVAYFTRIGGLPVPGMHWNPDRIENAGLGGPGFQAPGQTFRAVGGLVVVTFEEDVVVEDSDYPVGYDRHTVCHMGTNQPVPTVFSVPFPPTGCTSRRMKCRASFSDPTDSVCRYQCRGDDPDSVYVWRSTCP